MEARVSKTLVVYDILLAAFLAFSISAETRMSYTGDIRSIFPGNYIDAPTAGTIVLFAVLAGGFFACFRSLRKHFALGRHARAAMGVPAGDGLWLYARQRGGLFLGILAVVVLAWLAVLMQYWPGTSMNDQLSIIAQPVISGGTHPLVYNLALAGCVRVSHMLLGVGNPGFALYVIMQMIFCASVIAFCSLWLRYRGVPKPVVATVVLFFAFEPLLASFSINVWKDTLFGYVMLLWVPFLWESIAEEEVFWKRRGNYAVLCALIVATAFIRNNGLPLALVTACILVVVQRTRIDARACAVSLAVALAISLAPSAALAALDVHQLFREVVNIPIQQLAALQAQGVDDLPEADAEYLDTLMPAEQVGSTYMPVFADGIKFTGWFDPEYTLDETKRAFLRVYLDAGTRHPDIFLRAYFSQTYGNWSLLAPSGEQSYELAISANIPGGDYADLMEDFGLWNESMYPQPVQEFFDEAYPRLLAFPGPGACFAAMLLVGYALTMRLRSARPLLAIVPYVLLWATLMLATPLSLALRYVFPIITALPFLMAALAMSRSR